MKVSLSDWLISYFLKNKQKTPKHPNKLLQHITMFFINEATYILHEAFSWQPEETTINKMMCVLIKYILVEHQEILKQLSIFIALYITVLKILYRPSEHLLRNQHDG